MAEGRGVMPLVRRLKPAGIAKFEEYLNSLGAPTPPPRPVELLAQENTSDPLDVSIEIEERKFGSRLEAARYLDSRLSDSGLRNIERDSALWAWLTLFYFDELCPADATGCRHPGETARYVPQPQNYQRYYRHLLAGPYRIFRAHRDNPERALALLGGPLDRPGEIVEQFASRQELVTNRPLIQGITTLYWDPGARKPKRGAGGKGTGSPRRLADVLKQFDLTWDLYAMGADNLLGLLPKEFDRFRPAPAPAPVPAAAGA
jgi:hypothetical protein